jgi:hypothetical protein
VPRGAVHPGLRGPVGGHRRAARQAKVRQGLTAPERGPERVVRGRRRAEPARIAAVVPVRVRRRRDPPPGRPHVLIRQADPGRQPEGRERVVDHDRLLSSTGMNVPLLSP